MLSNFKNRWKKLKKIIGPGFITGAADNDPSGIATYSQTGAQFGLNQLWMALFTLPLMAAVQEMCTRISIVTRKGTMCILKEHYPKSIVIFTTFSLILVNTINIGADLSAIAECANLIFPINYYVYLILFSVLIVLLIVFIPYKRYARILLFFALFEFIYVIVGIKLNEDWGSVLRNLIPHLSLNKDALLNIVAILGTTISPYMFFWQPEQQIEEIKKEEQYGSRIQLKIRKQIKLMKLDTFFGMLMSNVIMFFIIIATGFCITQTRHY